MVGRSASSRGTRVLKWSELVLLEDVARGPVGPCGGLGVGCAVVVENGVDVLGVDYEVRLRLTPGSASGGEGINSRLSLSLSC